MVRAVTLENAVISRFPLEFLLLWYVSEAPDELYRIGWSKVWNNCSRSGFGSLENLYSALPGVVTCEKSMYILAYNGIIVTENVKSDENDKNGRINFYYGSLFSSAAQLNSRSPLTFLKDWLKNTHEEQWTKQICWERRKNCDDGDEPRIVMMWVRGGQSDFRGRK